MRLGREVDESRVDSGRDGAGSAGQRKGARLDSRATQADDSAITATALADANVIKFLEGRPVKFSQGSAAEACHDRSLSDESLTDSADCICTFTGWVRFPAAWLADVADRAPVSRVAGQFANRRRDHARCRSSTNATVVQNRKEAQAIMELLGEQREREVSVDQCAGPRARVSAAASNDVSRHRSGRVELIAPTSLLARRDIAFNESELLAKESEEVLLYRDMQSDLVRQIVNRLQGIKLSTHAS